MIKFFKISSNKHFIFIIKFYLRKDLYLYLSLKDQLFISKLNNYLNKIITKNRNSNTNKKLMKKKYLNYDKYLINKIVYFIPKKEIISWH